MGGGYSQEEYVRYSLKLYETSLQNTCVLPDIGIDESLLRYSGLNSTIELQSYSNELLNDVPGFVEKVGSGLGALTSVPNAVGLGALVISMLLEICTKDFTQTGEDSYSLIQRVFGEEKASGVRDKMSEYLKRHRMFISNDRRLLEEMRLLEQQLSDKLTSLRNSLLQDGQMSSTRFKIWVNGASFHVQMLIHEERLNFRAGKHVSDSVNTINAVINIYLEDLDRLLMKYKTYKTSTASLSILKMCFHGGCLASCYVKDTEAKCSVEHKLGFSEVFGPCEGSEMTEAYLHHVFSKYEPILRLKSHFYNIKNNIDFLIRQHDSFTLPSTT